MFLGREINFARRDRSEGIGTAAPATLLHVHQTTNTSGGGISVDDSSSARRLYLWSDGTNGRIDSSSNGGNPLVLNSGGGNVGIGTTNPATKLEVDYNVGGQAGLDLVNAGANGKRWRISESGTTNDGSLQFANITNSMTPLTLSASGNVGIGTTSPGAPLEIYSASGANGLLRMNAPSGQNRLTRYQTAGSNRWDLGVNSVSESGSNVGSDFFINLFSDAGAYLDTPLQITRSSGQVGLGTGGLYSFGNVGIGTVSPNVTGADRALTISAVGMGTGAYPATELVGTRTTNGPLGQVSFINSSGANAASSIYGVRDGANNSMGLAFYASNAGTAAEAMRVSAAGSVGMGISTLLS